MKLAAIFLMICFSLRAQNNAVVVGFWNVENLFDTIDDPSKNDEEFTPSGKYAWTTYRYLNKLNRMAEVILKLGAEQNPQGAALIGLCEVENARLLSDLVKMPALSSRNYSFVLIEGPDERGIDVALLFSPPFQPSASYAYKVTLPDTSNKTRSILHVKGSLAGESIHILVNHWPSRRGGEKASRPSRISAARICAHIIDSLNKFDTAKVIVMGDLNDDPDSYSVQRLGEKTGLTNVMLPLHQKGIGTLAWNDRWNLFDQFLLSPSFFSKKGLTYSRAYIFNRDFLTTDKGRHRGYPFRTYNAGVYTAGYSDHFPVYMVLSPALH